mgnify:CR=1 FL=1
MKYKEKETGKIKTIEEIKFEHNELINSSWTAEEIGEWQDITKYIEDNYIEVE